MRKLIYLLVFVIVASLAAWFYFMKDSVTVFNDNSAFKAVPMHSPLVIEVQNVSALLNAFSETNQITSELKNTGTFNQLSKELDYIKGLQSLDNEFAQLSAVSPILVSVNFLGKNEADFLFLISLKNKKEKNTIIEIIKKAASASSVVSKRNYDETEIYQATINNSAFTFAFPDGVFVASKRALLVEDAIRQSGTENLTDRADFQKLRKTSNSNTLANVYINHKKIPQLLGKALTPEMRKKFTFIADYADYTELDLNLKPTELFLNGFTSSNDSVENYINIFKGQEPKKSDIESVLPVNTSFFVALNIENTGDWFQKYQQFSRVQGSFYQHDAQLKEIQRESKCDLEKVFKEISTGEFAIAFTGISQNDSRSNRFFVMGINSASKAKEHFNMLLRKYASDKRVSESSFQTSFKVDEKKSLTLYKFPYPNVSEIMFGKIFSGVECKYFTYHGNHIIFASSLSGLKSYIQSLNSSSTLAKDLDYTKFRENISARSNLHCYINFSRCFHLNKDYLNTPLAKIWTTNEESFRKFYAMSWQFTTTEDMVLNNIYLKFDPTIKEEPQTIWEIKLDGTVFTKPQMVVNPKDPNSKEIIVQDNKNQLYLINKEGVILWKVPLSGPIMSEIYQIDRFKNGKMQYFFNTKNQLYMIDRTGQKVAGFPVALKSPASNGVAVIDFDNNKNYRFFIAFDNKKISAFSADGKPLKAWKDPVTESKVSGVIQYFKFGKQEYLVYSDKNKTYFLNRQGKPAVQSKASFEHSSNGPIFDDSGKSGLLYSDKSGKVFKLFFNGEYEKRDMGSFSANHFFEASDLDGNGKKETIFADGNKLVVFSDNGKKLFEKTFKLVITEKPVVYSFSAKSKKIGLVCGGENKVYLINADGSVYSSFPLSGCTKFSIGSLSKSNKSFNLVVGSEDNNLLNYLVE